jgi:nucleoside-diphosphate-sugar epimerase
MTVTNHDFWNGRTVMVSGAGFLGSHLIEDLEQRSDDVEIFAPRSNEYDLRKKSDIKRALKIRAKILLFILRQLSAGSVRTPKTLDGIFTTTR